MCKTINTNAILSSLMLAVEVRNLRKDFKTTVAVRGISFEVKEGEIFGLVGPNGAGKTTTLRIIATLLVPTSGEVKVYGKDVVREAETVRKLISYLPEEAGLYKNLTGVEYLRYMASFYTSDKKEIEEMVERGIKISELGDDIYRKTSEYSKGMSRRLQIARVFMSEPILAILDEPTSGLDVVHAYKVRRIIKEYLSENNAVLLSSHNMLEVEFLCQRVALINRGAIVAEGNIKDLIKRYDAENLEEVFVKVVRQ